METGSVFLNHRTQAVRLPKTVAFPPEVKRVEVSVVGDTRVLTPVYGSLAEWAARRRCVDPDFLAERDQGQAEERDWGAA
jgi:antitoxin VapB